MNQKLKKFITIFLILAQLSVPFFAFAQVGSDVPVSDSKTQTNTSFIGSQNDIQDASGQATAAVGNAIGGLFGISGLGDAANKVSGQVNTALNKIRSLQCITSKASDILSAADRVNKWSFGGLQLISGDAGQTALLSGKIEVLNDSKDCIDGQIKELTDVKPATLLGANQKQTLLDNLTKQKSTIDLRLESLNAQYANAEQGFWKTLVFNILIQTSKSVADALVNKLVSNYKINNIKQYIDSTATLMYDNQYLRDNFPDAQGQLMARAILNQPELRNQIQPGIFVAANAALGFTPSTLNPNDPNFYSKMAMVGSSSANPYFLQTSYVSAVDQSHNQAIIQAQNQVAQSQGFKTPVNCAGSLAQQQQIDAKGKAASDQLANRSALLASLQAAGASASQSDLAKAQADYNKALIAWNNVPFAVTGSSSVSNTQQGGGNNTEGTMAIAMCEAIASPATLINKGIDQAFNAIGVNMAQYNDNNLPSFISLIGNVASQIGSSLIFGGTNAAKGAVFANENKLVNGAVTAVNQTIASDAANKTANALTFIAVADPSTPNNYQLNFSVDTSAFPAADHINIVGDGINQTIKNTSGSTSVTTTKGGNYTMSVYDSGNALLASNSATISPNSASPSVGAPTVPSITIIPSSGAITAGGKVSIFCSGLVGLAAGSQIVVKVNGAAISQTIPVINGQCSATVNVSKANNFSSSGSNSVNAWVGDSAGDQIEDTPDVTANFSVTGTVAGAYTDQPSLQIRGPEPIFSPRG